MEEAIRFEGGASFLSPEKRNRSFVGVVEKLRLRPPQTANASFLTLSSRRR